MMFDDVAGLGGIGSLLLQLLNPVFGAVKVITTLSTAKVPLLSGLLGEGLVDQIVDYTKEDVVVEVGRQTVDVMFCYNLPVDVVPPPDEAGYWARVRVHGSVGGNIEEGLADFTMAIGEVDRCC